MKNLDITTAFLQKISIVAIAAGCLLSGSPSARAQGQATPEGFSDYLVLMATGTIPLGVPHPEIEGCSGDLFCDGDYFHKVIMGRTDAEIAEEARKAKDFMAERFGLDVDALVAAGRLAFFPFQIDPRGQYRAYTVAGAKVGSEGWIVRDGGFAAAVLDPNGIEMGGKFAGSGLVIPETGMVLAGVYNIQVTNPAGKPKGEVLVHYRSGMPMIPNDFGEFVINCQISLDEFGGDPVDGARGGKAQGMGLVLVDGAVPEMTLSWRNVVTADGLIVEPGD